MSVTEDLAKVHESAIVDFGQDVIYKPSGGSESAKRGLVETGVVLERGVPGTYSRLLVRASDFEVPPEEGDEVTLGDGVYKVYRIQSVDGGTGNQESRIHRLLLRHHRDVEGS